MKELIKIEIKNKRNLSDKEYLDLIRSIRSIINNEFKERISEGDDLNELFEFYGSELSYFKSELPNTYIDSVAAYLNDDVLCDLIDTASDWEFCEIHGLLDELADRSEIELNYNSDHWESDIDKAIEKLRQAN